MIVQKLKDNENEKKEGIFQIIDEKPNRYQENKDLK